MCRGLPRRRVSAEKGVSGAPEHFSRPARLRFSLPGTSPGCLRPLPLLPPASAFPWRIQPAPDASPLTEPTDLVAEANAGPLLHYGPQHLLKGAVQLPAAAVLLPGSREGGHASSARPAPGISSARAGLPLPCPSVGTRQESYCGGMAAAERPPPLPPPPPGEASPPAGASSASAAAAAADLQLVALAF